MRTSVGLRGEYYRPASKSPVGTGRDLECHNETNLLCYLDLSPEADLVLKIGGEFDAIYENGNRFSVPALDKMVSESK